MGYDAHLVVQCTIVELTLLQYKRLKICPVEPINLSMVLVSGSHGSCAGSDLGYHRQLPCYGMEYHSSDRHHVDCQFHGLEVL